MPVDIIVLVCLIILIYIILKNIINHALVCIHCNYQLLWRAKTLWSI